MEVRSSLWSNIIEILWHLKITTPKNTISTGWETINHLVRAPDTWHVWPMDNDGSLIVCQLLFTFQISFNSSPSRPHPWREPVICAWLDWLGQGMPGVDDTNYKTKASFHPSFRLLWPGLANTSLRKHEGELEFTRFNIFADTEWWVMERYSNVICDTRRGLSVPRLWSLTDHRGQVMSSLRSHHRRYYANMWRSFKKLSSSADIHECWHLRTDDEAVIVTATWSDIVQSQFQLLRIPQHLLINFTFLSGPDVEKWPDARSGNEEWEEVRCGTTSERCRV